MDPLAMTHLVLLGDSIFDNARYVPGEPCVLEQVRRALTPAWRVTLLALDGATTLDVEAQASRIPHTASHLVLSVGGNDALSVAGRLRGPCASFPVAMETLALIREEFLENYRTALQHVLRCGIPTLVCTVYDKIPGLNRGDSAGLALFNERILHEAARYRLSVIDLRLVCDERADYSAISPIEPSALGGAKIAQAIARALTEGAEHHFQPRIWT
jgi:hypothetical protein